MQISRRGALMGAGAAAVTGLTVAPLAMKDAGVQAALGGDTVILARVAQFHEVSGAFRSSWHECSEYRAKIEAMPDCPSDRAPWRDYDESSHETKRIMNSWERMAFGTVTTSQTE